MNPGTTHYDTAFVPTTAVAYTQHAAIYFAVGDGTTAVDVLCGDGTTETVKVVAGTILPLRSTMITDNGTGLAANCVVLR